MNELHWTNVAFAYYMNDANDVDVDGWFISCKMNFRFHRLCASVVECHKLGMMPLVTSLAMDIKLIIRQQQP